MNLTLIYLVTAATIQTFLEIEDTSDLHNSYVDVITLAVRVDVYICSGAGAYRYARSMPACSQLICYCVNI